MKKILIVVDMLNDFINEDGALYCGQTARDIVPHIKARINEYHENNYPIIFLADQHLENDLEFIRFPKHCVHGTYGAQVIKELPYNKTMHSLVGKTRYSGFYDTALDIVLSPHWKASIDTVIEVCGVCTSICVMDTVGGLANRDYPTVIHRNCVADFDDEMHKMSLKRMNVLYGTEII